MGLMYGWATPEKCLDGMTLQQLIKYHKKGWEAKQTENRVNWGILGMLLNGEDPEKPGKKMDKPSIDEIKRYPGYENAHFNEKGKLVRG